jgi:prevent-host-death family protein
MTMKRVSIQDLKPQLSSVLTEVESGATVEITRHGKPVARLAPVDSPHVHRGSQVGTYVWPPAIPTGVGKKRILEVLLEDREDRF